MTVIIGAPRYCAGRLRQASAETQATSGPVHPQGGLMTQIMPVISPGTYLRRDPRDCAVCQYEELPGGDSANAGVAPSTWFAPGGCSPLRRPVRP